MPCPPQISCQMSCLFPYEIVWGRFFLATPVALHVTLVYCICCSCFHFLGIIKVGHGVLQKPYQILSIICWFLAYFVSWFSINESSKYRRYETQPKAWSHLVAKTKIRRLLLIAVLNSRHCRIKLKVARKVSSLLPQDVKLKDFPNPLC